MGKKFIEQNEMEQKIFYSSLRCVYYVDFRYYFIYNKVETLYNSEEKISIE